MKIVSKTGNEDIATVYVADMGKGRMVEFVESVQPPIPREKKWVLIISTLFGCPVGCRMCDAGGDYRGKLTTDEILAQIDFLVGSRFADGNVPVEKFKIQFARMGEPALNKNVLDALEKLPARYNTAGIIMPCLSTVAPEKTDSFFERLLSIKRQRYSRGRFQLQFSLHSTDPETRDYLMPIAKWPLSRIAEYGNRFCTPPDRKVTLNFAIGKDAPVDANLLCSTFDPDKFLIKITPVNPTLKARQNNLVSDIDPDKLDDNHNGLLRKLRAGGFDIIVSIGELEENKIGSNCGQYLNAVRKADLSDGDAYTYPVEQLA